MHESNSVSCECKLCFTKDPIHMTPEELEMWRSQHSPDEMGYVGKEGVDEDE